jgi:hypothetical protein
MQSTSSSSGSQGNRGHENRGGSGGRSSSRGEAQGGQPEPTMAASSGENNREHSTSIAAQALSGTEPQASTQRGPHASHTQPPSGTQQGTRIPVTSLLQRGTRIPVTSLLRRGTPQPAASPTSRPGEPIHPADLVGARPDPVHNLTSTTRSMSIASTPAQAPLGVGPGIGSHGLQHPGLTAPPANPSIRPPRAQAEPEGKTCERCKTLNLRCDKNKPRCSHCLMGQHQCSLGEVLDVKIQRPDGSLHKIYRQGPPGHTPKIWPGDEIIGWDPLIGFGGLAPGFGSFVICPANRAGLLAHELGKNHLGHPAISADEHEQHREILGSGPALGPAQPLQHSQSGIGGYGEQHQRAPGPSPGPGPAQPLQQAKQACYSCANARSYKSCNGKEPCSYCSERNLRCIYQQPPNNAPGLFKQCDYCRRHELSCDKKRPCSRCIKDGRCITDEANCHYSEDPKRTPAGKAGEKFTRCDYCRNHKAWCDRKKQCSQCIKNKTECHYSDLASGPLKPVRKAGESSVASSQKVLLKRCNYCRAQKTRNCSGQEPCSTCIKNNRGANCEYEEKYREEPTTSGREIDFDEIVPNVRIRREDHSEDLVYVHPPGHNRRPEGVAENMIIGWDRRGSWVIRPANGAGLLPGELGINDAGERAIRVDEGEPAGEMGGMRDMRAAATASRPPAQPQGFGVPGPSAPAHSVQGHNLAGSRHQRTSTESPPAEDLAKRRRGPR